MRKERKHYTAEEKVAVLRRHLLDKVPVSDLCEELGLKPTVFYRCKRSSSRTERLRFRLRSVPTAGWRRSRNGLSSWRKVQSKDEVLAELMAEHVALKKVLGKSNWQLGTA
jgi:transposase